MPILPWTATISGTGGGPLLLMQPNGGAPDPRPLLLQGENVEGASGARFFDKTSALPQERYEFQFVCETRAKFAALKAFFDARRGRFAPFWFPVWTRPFNVADYYDGVLGGVWAEGNGYTRDVVPVAPAYHRFVVFWGGYYATRLISAVTPDSPAAGIDRLVVSDTGSTMDNSVLAYPWTAEKGAVPIRLAYGRFDTDDFVPERVGDGGGIVTLAFLELPDEATEPA